ncbi:MAG: WG repeat-containing protein [Saprospiraceae bacterium]
MKNYIFMLLALLSWKLVAGQAVCTVKSFEGEIATGSKRIGFHAGEDGFTIKIDSNKNYSFIDTAGEVFQTGFTEFIRRTREFTLAKKTESKKWGMLRADFSILINFEYEDILYEPFWPGFKCVVKKNQKWGVIDSLGKELLPVIYNEIRFLTKHVCFVMKGDSKFLYFFKNDKIINIDGVCVKPYEDTSNEIAVVFERREDSAVGAYDIYGNVIFEGKYAGAKHLDLRQKGKGKANFCFIVNDSDGKLGLLNSEGKSVADISFDEIEKARSSSKWGLEVVILKKNGRKYLYSNGTLSEGIFDTHQFELAEKPSRAIFSSLSKYGVYDFIEHKILIDPIYDKVSFLDDIGYVLEKDGKYGVVSMSGDVLLEIEYEGRLDYVRQRGKDKENYYAVVKDGKHGYLNEDFEFLMKPKYHMVRAYQEGMARVMEDYRWGFIDTAFNEVVEVKYDYVNPFVDGKSKAIYKGKEIYIDKLGNCIENCE